MKRQWLTLGLLFATGIAQAGPPVAFGGWNAQGGVINATCPSGYSCEDNVNDRGILQRILTDPNGKRFIQLVIQDSNAQGSLSVESFVDASANANRDGIAIRQILDSPTPQGGLSASATLYTGWAIDPNTPAIQLDQTLVDNDPASQNFTSAFRYEVDRDPAGNRLGHYLDTRVDIFTPNGNGGMDQDTAVIRQASGSRVTQSGSVSLPGRGGMMMGGGGRGGSLSWQNGDTLQTLWVAQQCEGCRTSGGMGGMGGGGGGGGLTLFSYQAFDNLSDSTGEINSYSLSDTAPLAWPDPPLGPAPTFQ